MCICVCMRCIQPVLYIICSSDICTLAYFSTPTSFYSSIRFPSIKHHLHLGIYLTLSCPLLNTFTLLYFCTQYSCDILTLVHFSRCNFDVLSHLSECGSRTTCSATTGQLDEPIYVGGATMQLRSDS